MYYIWPSKLSVCAPPITIAVIPGSWCHVVCLPHLWGLLGEGCGLGQQSAIHVPLFDDGLHHLLLTFPPLSEIVHLPQGRV